MWIYTVQKYSTALAAKVYRVVTTAGGLEEQTCNRHALHFARNLEQRISELSPHAAGVSGSSNNMVICTITQFPMKFKLQWPPHC